MLCPLKRRVWFCVSSAPPSPDHYLSAIWKDAAWLKGAFPNTPGGVAERGEGESLEEYTQRLVFMLPFLASCILECNILTAPLNRCLWQPRW